MKRKATQNITVLSASRPDVSVVEQTPLSIEMNSKRESIDGVLKGSKGPHKGLPSHPACTGHTLPRWHKVMMMHWLAAGHGVGPLPLSNLQHRAELSVLTSSLIAKAVNKSLDEVRPGERACLRWHTTTFAPTVLPCPLLQLTCRPHDNVV